MNNLKNKLIASTAMLLVAAIMLTSASFAWYTVSKQGELSEINVEMVAMDNIEIAISEATPGEVALGNTGDQQTWGGTATYTGTASVAQLASMSGATISTAQYDATGRLLATLTECVKSTDTDSVATYSNTTAKPQMYEDNEGNKCAARYDFWIRSNTYATASLIATNTNFTGKGMTVKFTQASGNSETPLTGTWNASNSDAITVNLNDDSTFAGTTTAAKTAHVYMYVYVDGDTTYSADVDSAETLPKFSGKIIVASSSNIN